MKVYIDYAMHDQKTQWQKVYMYDNSHMSNDTIPVNDIVGRRIIAVEKDDRGMIVLTLELLFK
jgi:hypothetical protein